MQPVVASRSMQRRALPGEYLTAPSRTAQSSSGNSLQYRGRVQSIDIETVPHCCSCLQSALPNSRAQSSSCTLHDDSATTRRHAIELQRPCLTDRSLCRTTLS